MELRKSAALTLGAMLLLAACNASTASPGSSGAAAGGGGKDPDGALVKRSDIKIEVVTHGQAQDGFWGVVRNGVKAGGNDMGVSVNYSAPGAESDMPAMSALIDAAVAKKPSGLVVSIPNADALSPSIKKAVAAGIPVVSMNSGSDVFKDLGILAHVGQTEFQAGLGAGKRFKDAGVKNAVCFNQEVGNQALTLRCNGFFTGMGLGRSQVGQGPDRQDLRPGRHAGDDLGGAPVRSDDRRPPDPRPVRGDTGPRRRRCRGQADPPRDLRPQRRRADGDQGRQDGLRHRPAAVPAGLSADRHPDELRADQESPDGRRDRPDHDRPGLRHEGRRG